MAGKKKKVSSTSTKAKGLSAEARKARKAKRHAKRLAYFAKRRGEEVTA